MHAVANQAITIRPLTPADLPAVVAIDATIEDHSRRTYIERRLRSALRDPHLHAQFAAVDSQGLAGYLLGRVLQGEFGRDERALRIELVGVRGDLRGRGVGSQLFGALAGWAARHDIGALRTLLSQLFTNLGALRIERIETVIEADDDALHGFLKAGGFTPSQRIPFVRRTALS
jgi:GNAT superfamily N-acetyltransferase